MFRIFLWHRSRARQMLSVAGIALGVALGYAVQLVNRYLDLKRSGRI